MRSTGRQTPSLPRVFPTADEIAARAHELFISHGRRLVDIPEHWRAAEQELLERAARRVIPPGGLGRLGRRVR